MWEALDELNRAEARGRLGPGEIGEPVQEVECHVGRVKLVRSEAPATSRRGGGLRCATRTPRNGRVPTGIG